MTVANATAELTPARTRAARHRHRKPARKGRLNSLIPILLVLVGIGVFLYPVVATQYNNVKQHEFASRYNAQTKSVPSEQLATALKAARDYNANLKGVPILDPWLTMASGDPRSAAYNEYLAQLSAFDAMARLRVPGLSIDLPIYHGTTDDVLAKGVGHLYGTSLPVGGTSTHSVLTSHTGMSNATLFDHLKDAKVGDTFYIDVYGETLAYQVESLKVVLPSETKDLVVAQGKDLVTLVTCTPYAVNTHRLLVTAHRIPYTPEKDKPADTAVAAAFAFETWMYWLIGAAVLSALALLALLVAGRRRRKRRRAQAASPR